MQTIESGSVVASTPADARPLVLHVVYRFDTGGLENGVVNLINHMPGTAYRHAVLALTEITDFRERVRRRDVEFIALQKPPGHGFWLYPRLYRLFRKLRPAIVHSRNLAALEVQVPAWAAGVPVRIHGEHGRDVGDLDGSNRTYQRMRRLYKPFVSHYFALSKDLAQYLSEKVRVPAERLSQVYNGVDFGRFSPAAQDRAAIAGCPFVSPDLWLVGTVGRMQSVKDQITLAKAFILAIQMAPGLRSKLRLVMVGEGPLRAQSQQLLADAGMAELAWLPGERIDVPDIMRALDCFVLPSLAEGISNTILEAMATGLPVVATDVGGNADLVADGQTGCIVPPDSPAAIAESLVRLASSPDLARGMGAAGRRRAEERFSMQAMVDAYQGIYDRQMRAVQP
jgi:sugar transferase (PEP-CTERM/EpsH1 system associated)